LIANIKKNWKNRIKTERKNSGDFQANICPVLNINKVIKFKKTTNKLVYNINLQKNKQDPSKSEERWNSEYGNLNWKRI
jgi:hypothetical protein